MASVEPKPDQGPPKEVTGLGCWHKVQGDVLRMVLSSSKKTDGGLTNYAKSKGLISK